MVLKHISLHHLSLALDACINRLHYKFTAHQIISMWYFSIVGSRTQWLWVRLNWGQQSM